MTLLRFRMTKRILSLLAVLCSLLPFSGRAQLSQVKGNVNCQVYLTLNNSGNAIANSSAQLQLGSFIQGAFPGGTNTSGVGNANQMFYGQFSVTNGALVGTNWINLHSLTTNDPVGNAYSLTQVKFIAFQNLGVSGSAQETNIVQVQGANGTLAWTNLIGTGALTIGGPSSNTPPAAVNNPVAMFWNPGDVGWTVGTSTDNTMVLTNPVAGSSPVLVNVYIVGSTSL